MSLPLDLGGLLGGLGGGGSRTPGGGGPGGSSGPGRGWDSKPPKHDNCDDDWGWEKPRGCGRHEDDCDD